MRVPQWLYITKSVLSDSRSGLITSMKFWSDSEHDSALDELSEGAVTVLKL